MIIACDQCNKKFEIDSNLIPKEGRLLKCGSCEHVWFYKFEDNFVPKKTSEDKELQKPHTKVSTKIDKTIENNIKKNIKRDYNIEEKKIVENKKIGFLNLLLVFIISFVALLILLETFKGPISRIFPEINFLLNSLYEIIKDVTLFFKDLIN
tara:strand:+ start:141 stop:596 length:456 start_codon:yes stop_codon:yes gene_type:complete